MRKKLIFFVNNKIKRAWIRKYYSTQCVPFIKIKIQLDDKIVLTNKLETNIIEATYNDVLKLLN